MLRTLIAAARSASLVQSARSGGGHSGAPDDPLQAGVNGAIAWDTTSLLGSDELLALHILPTGTRPRLIAPASPTS